MRVRLREESNEDELALALVVMTRCWMGPGRSNTGLELLQQQVTVEASDEVLIVSREANCVGLDCKERDVMARAKREVFFSDGG